MKRSLTSMTLFALLATAAGCKSEKPQDKPEDKPQASASAAAVNPKGPKGSTSGAASGDTTAKPTTTATEAAAAEVPRMPVPEHAPKEATSGFVPAKDGFKFQNYGNEIAGLVNLTAEDLKRLFGDSVCASNEGGHCTLTPAGQQWMEEQNKGMDGGHCEGFAALALMIHEHKVDMKDLGGAAPMELHLEANTKLMREIAYWFVTQATEPTRKMELKGYTPTQIVDIYADSIGAKKEVYSLGFYKRGGGGGHAVTPYAVADKGHDTQWIMVYDNNYPGEEKHVEVNRVKNTWTYTGATRPDVAKSEYEGDAETKTLTLTPSSARLVPQECPFCGEVAAAAPAPKGSRQIWLDGEADLLIDDGAGHKLGMENGKLVNTIPGADTVSFKSRDAMNHEPIYFIPEGGKKLEVTLDGATLKKDSPADVTLIGHGYAFAAKGITLHPGQKDHLTFSPDFTEIKYKTETKETPTIMLGIQAAGADYTFLVKVSGEAAGQEIDLKVDVAKGTISVFVHGKDPTAKFDITVHRIDPTKGDEVYEHKGTAIAAADTMVFNYKDWKGPHQPMSAGTDKGGDGTVEETAPQADQH